MQANILIWNLLPFSVLAVNDDIVHGFEFLIKHNKYNIKLNAVIFLLVD